MKRASYKDAIRWIAENDSASDPNNMDPTTVGELITSCLVADLFDVPEEKVGTDVVKYRANLREKQQMSQLDQLLSSLPIIGVINVDNPNDPRHKKPLKEFFQTVT